MSIDSERHSTSERSRVLLYRMGVEIGLQRLLENEKIDSVHFWGRIRGITKDYYLAVGLKMKDEYEFPSKRFYWRY